MSGSVRDSRPRRIRSIVGMLPVVAPHDAGQQAVERDGNDAVSEDPVLNRLGPLARRRVRQLQQADLLHGPSCQVQPGRPAHLRLTVDVVYVAVRPPFQPVLRHREQLRSTAEDQRLGGARRGTRRIGTGSLGAVGAELTLAHAGLERLVELVRRNLERAGNLAVPASDADRGVVDHRPVRRLGQRADDAGRDARGIKAVHALDLRSRSAAHPAWSGEGLPGNWFTTVNAVSVGRRKDRRMSRSEKDSAVRGR